MLFLIFTSILGAEGSGEWRESPFKMNVYNCSTLNILHRSHLPEEYFFPSKKIEVASVETVKLFNFSGVKLTPKHQDPKDQNG